jgi:hypothetical protein
MNRTEGKHQRISLRNLAGPFMTPSCRSRIAHG